MGRVGTGSGRNWGRGLTLACACGLVLVCVSGSIAARAQFVTSEPDATSPATAKSETAKPEPAKPSSPLPAPAPSPPPAAANAAPTACQKSDFEAVVEDSATALRDLNVKNKPAYQDKLKQLKAKRGWTHEQFMTEAAPFVRDDKITEFDQQTDDLLSAMSMMGQEGAAAKTPDCALLLELRARLKVLVDTQNAKWAYMFQKLETELWK